MYEKFLLEHYTQVFENLRDSDRKRDLLLGTYFTLSAAGMGFCFGTLSEPGPNQYYRIVIISSLVILGVMVSIIVTRFRGWHAEYANVTMAIHKCLMDGHCDLFKAAEDLKAKNKYPYFSAKGVEFMMTGVTLLFLSSEVAILILWVSHFHRYWLSLLLAALGFIITMSLGFWQYWFHLTSREKKYPNNSYCILSKKYLI